MVTSGKINTLIVERLQKRRGECFGLIRRWMGG